MAVHSAERRWGEGVGIGAITKDSVYIMGMETVARTKAEIIERIRESEGQLRALGVKRLALFGSFVRGASHSQSDVDLLVEFEPGQKTFDHFMALSFLLETLLQRPVELVTIEALSPFRGPHILEMVDKRLDGTGKGFS